MQLPVQGLDESTASVPPWIALPFHLPNQAGHIRETLIEVPIASDWSLSHAKRLFDISAALFWLLLFADPHAGHRDLRTPVLQGTGLVCSEPNGPWWAQLFGICKFRSMAVGSCAGSSITRSGDRRVTALGYWLRRFKLDELPQFYNILRGEMSLRRPPPKTSAFRGNRQHALSPRSHRRSNSSPSRREEELLEDIHASELDVFYAKGDSNRSKRGSICVI